MSTGSKYGNKRHPCSLELEAPNLWKKTARTQKEGKNEISENQPEMWNDEKYLIPSFWKKVPIATLPKAGLWMRNCGASNSLSRGCCSFPPSLPHTAKAVQSYAVGHKCFYNLYQGNHYSERSLHLKSLRLFTPLEQPSLWQARDIFLFGFFFF